MSIPEKGLVAMMRCFAVLGLLVTQTALALTDPVEIQQIQGPLSRDDAKAAIKKRESWFDRATLTCRSKTPDACKLLLTLTINESGRNPDCVITASRINSKQINGLFCSVANTLVFPPQNAPTTLTLTINRVEGDDPLVAAAPATVLKTNEQLDETAAAKPASTRSVIDTSGLKVSAAIKQATASTGTPCMSETKSRDSEAIRQCFDYNGAMFDGIYQQALRRDPRIAGNIRLSIDVEANGQVSAATATVLRGYLPESLAKQTVDAVTTLNFGPAGEKKTVSHDLNFLPQ